MCRWFRLNHLIVSKKWKNSVMNYSCSITSKDKIYFFLNLFFDPQDLLGSYQKTSLNCIFLNFCPLCTFSLKNLLKIITNPLKRGNICSLYLHLLLFKIPTLHFFRIQIRQFIKQKVLILLHIWIIPTYITWTNLVEDKYLIFQIEVIIALN